MDGARKPIAASTATKPMFSAAPTAKARPKCGGGVVVVAGVAVRMVMGMAMPVIVPVIVPMIVAWADRRGLTWRGAPRGG